MSEVAQAPQLRFPEFNHDWSISTIGNLAKIDTGNRDTQDRVNSGKYPFYVRSNTVERINEYTFDGEAILTSGDGVGVGKNFHYVIGKFNYHQRVYSIHNFTNLTNGKFVYYYFADKFYRRVSRLSAKNSVDSVRMSMISDMPISIPTKPEQQKIAEFLTAVDNKIEQLSKKQELLSEYKKGLMQKIFSQAIRFKADDGSTFPEWKEKKLGDIVRFENGKGHEQNISKDGKFIVVNSKFISSQGRVKKYTDTQKSPLNFGDVVMVMSDVPNGKALAKCYYIEQDNLYSLNQRICGLKHKLADTKFIYYRINRHKYFLSFDSGVGQTNLKKMEILNCPLNIPTDIKEQAKIANFLSSVDNKIEQMGKQLDESKQFKKALLQQMFV